MFDLFKKYIFVIFLKYFTIPGFMSFKLNDGSSYRITGYYYRYYYNNGKSTDPYPCSRFKSNCIGGYGVCGAYVPFSEVKSIKFTFNKARLFFFKEYLNQSKKQYLKEYNKKVNLLRSFPNKLSKKELDEMLLKWAVNSALKKLNKY